MHGQRTTLLRIGVSRSHFPRTIWKLLQSYKKLIAKYVTQHHHLDRLAVCKHYDLDHVGLTQQVKHCNALYPDKRVQHTIWHELHKTSQRLNGWHRVSWTVKAAGTRIEMKRVWQKIQRHFPFKDSRMYQTSDLPLIASHMTLVALNVAVRLDKTRYDKLHQMVRPSRHRRDKQHFRRKQPKADRPQKPPSQRTWKAKVVHAKQPKPKPKRVHYIVDPRFRYDDDEDEDDEDETQPQSQHWRKVRTPPLLHVHPERQPQRMLPQPAPMDKTDADEESAIAEPTEPAQGVITKPTESAIAEPTEPAQGVIIPLDG